MVAMNNRRCSKMYDILQRKDTLLQEYKIRKKSNMFVDKRIGEKDASLTAEDKMIARLVLLWKCVGGLCPFLPWKMLEYRKARYSFFDSGSTGDYVSCWMCGGSYKKVVNGRRR